MNLAYIISAYRLPELLVRLVCRLDSPGTSFFIHVDAKTPEPVYRAMREPLAELPNVVFLPRHTCHWGDFGHVRATLKGLVALLESGRPFDYVTLMTGQDYPLRSNAAIRERLASAGGAVFMESFPIPGRQWTEGGLDRIQHWHFHLGGRPLSFPGAPFEHSVANRVWSLPATVLRLRRRFPEGFRPYGGSSYWTMPAECARWVHDFVRGNERFVRFFRFVHVPDEIFFQTIVMRSPFGARVAADNLHYHDWSGDGDHPEVLTSGDLDALMRTDKLFARKFDPGVDAAVLDRIDSILDGEA